MSNTAALPKPVPVAKPETLSVQIVTRVSNDGRETIKALAAREQLTVQQLGLYAWSLALKEYGLPPLTEG
jgi:hypothetical protein